MLRAARPPLARTLSTMLGVIAPDCLYRMDEAAARMGWGGHALRAARRRGLVIHRCGKRGYILGRDIIAYVTGGTDAT